MHWGLLLFLMITANLTLYWLFFGQKKWQEKIKAMENKEGLRPEKMKQSKEFGSAEDATGAGNVIAPVHKNNLPRVND